MKKHFFYLILLVIASVVSVSCEKYNDNDAEINKEANSRLTIRTRAAANVEETEKAEISYPVNIYIFNSSNACAAMATIGAEESQMSIKLPEGNYTVYAIAGADKEKYELPTKENATKESIIKLKEGQTHGDLMTAHNTVNLTYGEDNTLTLSLSRKVMLLETVTISQVPSSVTAVTVTVSPLYDNLLLDGSYDGENGLQTVNLTKEGETGTWKNSCNTYLLEASGPATIKVALTTSSGTKSYSYSSTDELKANYKINISGTYTSDGISLNGTITGATWEGTKDITFTFDENGSTAEEKPDTGGEETSGNAPEAGTLYKGAYVLKSETSGSSTTVTLMSTEYKDKLSFTKGDQASMKVATSTAITELAVEGITSWRLATLEELKYIKNNIETINKNLKDNGKTEFLIDAGSSVFSYYCLSTDNEIITYCPYRDDTNASPNPDTASNILRAFASVTFTE